jgi:hypothetical protein
MRRRLPSLAGTLGAVLIQVISSTTREGRFSERTLLADDLTWWASALAAARAREQR